MSPPYHARPEAYDATASSSTRHPEEHKDQQIPTLPSIREMFPHFDDLMRSGPPSPQPSAYRMSPVSSSSSPGVESCLSSADSAAASEPLSPHTQPTYAVMSMSTAGLNTVQSSPATPLSRSNIRLLTDRAVTQLAAGSPPYPTMSAGRPQPTHNTTAPPNIVAPAGPHPGSGKRYHCPRCGRGFSTQSNVWRHRRAAHPEEEIPLRSMRGRSCV